MSTQRFWFLWQVSSCDLANYNIRFWVVSCFQWECWKVVLLHLGPLSFHLGDWAVLLECALWCFMDEKDQKDSWLNHLTTTLYACLNTYVFIMQQIKVEFVIYLVMTNDIFMVVNSVIVFFFFFCSYPKFYNIFFTKNTGSPNIFMILTSHWIVIYCQLDQFKGKIKPNRIYSCWGNKSELIRTSRWELCVFTLYNRIVKWTLI